MDLIKEYMSSSSPESSPPEALREPPCREGSELEVSVLSEASERKEPVAWSTPASVFGVSAGSEVLSGSPGHTPYPYKKDVAPRR